MLRETDVQSTIPSESKSGPVRVVVRVLRAAILKRLDADQEVRKGAESGAGRRRRDARPNQIVDCRSDIGDATRYEKRTDIALDPDPLVDPEVGTAANSGESVARRIAAGYAPPT